MQSTLNAATQGKLGRHHSQGTLSISLEIPEFSQLRVDAPNNSVQEQFSVCLNLMDRRTGRHEKYFRVAGLNGELTPTIDMADTEFENHVELVKIENALIENQDGSCHVERELEASNNDKSPMLLVLIAE